MTDNPEHSAAPEDLRERLERLILELHWNEDLPKRSRESWKICPLRGTELILNGETREDPMDVIGSRLHVHRQLIGVRVR